MYCAYKIYDKNSGARYTHLYGTFDIVIKMKDKEKNKEKR